MNIHELHQYASPVWGSEAQLQNNKQAALTLQLK